jgi:Flp pilus assembly CpaE family ATPase
MGADGLGPATVEDVSVGGPLLAICGLCGGAGASTLTWLVARAAAQRASAPVLACDSGGPGAGLATYAGIASPRSLTGAARALAEGDVFADGLYACHATGPRVVARGPDLDAGEDSPALRRLLSDACAAHRLTVVDCGTLARPADHASLETATHVAWVLPASVSGVMRTRRLLDDLPPARVGREVVVARRDSDEQRARLEDLAAIADERGASLVLVPHLPEAEDEALEIAQTQVRAILALVER